MNEKADIKRHQERQKELRCCASRPTFKRGRGQPSRAAAEIRYGDTKPSSAEFEQNQTAQKNCKVLLFVYEEISPRPTSRVWIAGRDQHPCVAHARRKRPAGLRGIESCVCVACGWAKQKPCKISGRRQRSRAAGIADSNRPSPCFMFLK